MEVKKFKNNILSDMTVNDLIQFLQENVNGNKKVHLNGVPVMHISQSDISEKDASDIVEIFSIEPNDETTVVSMEDDVTWERQTDLINASPSDIAETFKDICKSIISNPHANSERVFKVTVNGKNKIKIYINIPKSRIEITS